MSTKKIFLDFDGVIATRQSYALAREQYGNMPETGFPPGLHLIDSKLCARVQSICNATEAEIIISSTWRELYEWDELIGFLRHHGIAASIVDKTPSRGKRGFEIQCYMDEHPELSYTDIVVLDDDISGIWPYKKVYDRLIFTTFEEGLTEQDVEDAIETLMKG